MYHSFTSQDVRALPPSPPECAAELWENARVSGAGGRMTLPIYGFTESAESPQSPLMSLTVPPPRSGLCFLWMLHGTCPGEVPDCRDSNMTGDDIQLPQDMICAV